MRKPIHEIIDGHKECNQCRRVLPSNKFRTRTKHGRQYLIAKCRKCETQYNKEHRDDKRRRESERKRFKDPLRRERKNAVQREWRKNNILKNRAYHNKCIKKNVDELSDSYVGGLLTHSGRYKKGSKKRSRGDIPKELIDLKKQHLILKREVQKIIGKKI